MTEVEGSGITKDNAFSIEKELVHKVYDAIAPSFSQTRHKPWPNVKEYVQSLKPGTVMLDVGCGNGKYFNLNSCIFEIGTDVSIGLTEICRSRNFEVALSNVLELPFKDNFFDSVISIALLHHLATDERRLNALSEIYRVLKPNSTALIYVWAQKQASEKDQKSFYAKNQECKQKIENNKLNVDKKFSFLPVQNRSVDFVQSDVIVPWINKTTTTTTEDPQIFHRYYHVFNNGELENLTLKLKPRPKIIKSYYEQGNWCILFEKTTI